MQVPDRIVLEEHRTRLVVDEGEEGEEHGQQRHHDQQDDGQAAVCQQGWIIGCKCPKLYLFTSKSTHDASSLCSKTSSTLSNSMQQHKIRCDVLNIRWTELY